MSSVPRTSSPSSTRSGKRRVRDSAGTRLPAGALLVASLLCACASPPQTRQLLNETDGGLPQQVELAHTPFFPQQRYQCGPAALATVLAARGISVTSEALEERVYIPGLHGSLREELTAAARNYGMLAYTLRPSLADLLEEVAHGNPVLVFQNPGLPAFPQWHFAVVIGYDLGTREIVLRSGKTPRWRTSLANFERTWSRGNYWALVILPAGEIPATADLAGYLRAARDLEVSGKAASATTAFRSATRHWPQAPTAWLAWGNNRYAAGEFTQSEAAFREAARLAPDDPRAWNNLAYALLESACPGQARQAAECAATLAPEAPEYRETQKEILARTQGDKLHAGGCAALHCPAVAERNRQ